VTKLSGNDTVTRETAALYRGTPLVVELGAHNIVLREKAKRSRITVPILAVYDLGFKLIAREARAEKLLRKKGRRG
jgi:hypothetical protein